eukprot:5127284-Amphidinium_carterae.3
MFTEVVTDMGKTCPRHTALTGVQHGVAPVETYGCKLMSTGSYHAKCGSHQRHRVGDTPSVFCLLLLIDDGGLMILAFLSNFLLGLRHVRWTQCSKSKSVPRNTRMP